MKNTFFFSLFRTLERKDNVITSLLWLSSAFVTISAIVVVSNESNAIETNRLILISFFWAYGMWIYKVS